MKGGNCHPNHWRTAYKTAAFCERLFRRKGSLLASCWWTSFSGEAFSVWAGPPPQLFLLLVRVLQLAQEEWVVFSANKGGLQAAWGFICNLGETGGLSVSLDYILYTPGCDPERPSQAPLQGVAQRPSSPDHKLSKSSNLDFNIITQELSIEPEIG